ncbi:MAG: SLC13 family permease, partial [Planctomycetota bacterium]
MPGAQILVAAILAVTLALQAALPASRLLIVVSGAAASSAAVSVLGLGTTRALLGDVPWDVIVILVALGLLTEVFVTSRVFGALAVASTRWSRGKPRRVFLIYAIGMYFVSCLANNLTALLLVLPILLVHLKLLGATQSYVRWILGVLLVSCNLGGAATPIGDFPAILLLGRGEMTFGGYLVNAAPPTIVALALLIGLVLVAARSSLALERDAAATRLSTAIMEALHRNAKIDWRGLAPALGILAVMLVAWTVVPVTTGF